MEQLRGAVLRVRAPGDDGFIAGAGVLVAPRMAVTCAHVVSDALGLARDEWVPPGEQVAVDLPLNENGGHGRTVARVERWRLAPDVALLRLDEEPPGARPASLLEARRLWGHEARVVGFPEGWPGGTWHTGRLLERTAEGWVQFTQADGHGSPVTEGFSGSPVWDAELGHAVGIVVMSQYGNVRQSALIPAQRLAEELPELGPIVSPESPFRGLEAFQEADSGCFHGREEESRALAALVRAEPVVTVYGTSGCGKSSAAQAGALPLLRRDGYAAVTVRAGDPAGLLGALARELTRLTRPGLEGAEQRAEARRVKDELREHGMADLVAEALGTGGATGLVVVVDQLEELLADTGVEDAVRVLFPDDPPPGLRVLSTLRVDFLGAISEHGTLERTLRGEKMLLLPMNQEQLGRVVGGPLADVPSVDFEEGLQARILRDVESQPGVLPLLEFTLQELWQRRRGGALTHDAYEELGEVKGALAARAEAVWAAHVRPDAATGPARRLFTRLVRVPYDERSPTRRVVPRAELGEGEWPVAQVFAAERLLVLGRDEEADEESVELAHEALIGAWDRLSGWVESDRDFQEWRTEVGQDRVRGKYLTEFALRNAEKWLRGRPEDVAAQDRAFIEESARRRDARRRALRIRDRAVRGLAVLLAGATAAATWTAVDLDDTNSRLDAQLRRVAAAQLAAEAEQIDDTSLTTSALLTAAAHRTDAGAESRSALMQQHERLRNVERIALEGRGQVEDVALSEDGSYLNAQLDHGTIVAVRGTRDASAPRNLSKAVSDGMAMSADGEWSALTTDRGTISVRNNRNRDSAALRSGEDAKENPRAAHSIRFDGPGERLVAAVPGEGAQAWDVEGARRVGKTMRPPGGWTVREAWFGAGGTVVGRVEKDQQGDDGDDGDSGQQTSRLVLWDLDSGKLTLKPGGGKGTDTPRATVSADGTTLVRCTPDNTLESWDLSRRPGKPRIQKRYTSRQVDQPCATSVVRVDATGRYAFVPAARYGPKLGLFPLVVLDLRTGHRSRVELPAPAVRDERLISRGKARDTPALSVAGPPERMRVAVSVGGSVAVARIARPGAFDSAMLNSMLRTADADHRQVASVDQGGKGLRLWDLKSHEQLAAKRPSAPLQRQYAAFSPDGKRLLTATADGRAVLVWSLPGLRELGRLELPAPQGIDPGRKDERTGLTPSLTMMGFDTPDTAVISAASYVSRWDLRTGRVTGRMFRPPATDDRNRQLYQVAHQYGVARPGHRQAAVLTEAEKIVIWDFARGRKAATIETPPDTVVRNLAFDPEGRLLAITTRSGGLRIWDMERKAWRRALAYNGVQYVGAFAAQGRLVAQSINNEFTAWDTGDGEQLYRFTLGFAPTADLDAKGTTMALIDGSDARLVPLEEDAWRERLCELAGRGLTKGERRLMPEGGFSGDVCGDG